MELVSKGGHRVRELDCIFKGSELEDDSKKP